MSKNNEYHDISRDEFETFMSETYGVSEPVETPRNTHELVYEIPIDGSDTVSVRVFSTLDDRHHSAARDAGNDAIRAVVWDATKDKPIDAATRTHRIPTWKSNLAPKIDDMIESATDTAQARAHENDAVVAEFEALPLASGADDEIVAIDVRRTEYGPKASLDTPYEAKDAIKGLDWDATHRSWEASRKVWTIDADALSFARSELADAGFALVRADDDSDESDAFDPEDSDVELFDQITVTYTGKNNGNEHTKSGEVTARASDRISFTRDDGHTMYITDEGLYTVGSHAPYVGEVQQITID